MEIPATATELTSVQQRLAAAAPAPFVVPHRPLIVAAAFVCFGRDGAGAGTVGDPGWAAAVVMETDRVVDRALVAGRAGGPYRAGMLALREGPLLAAAVAALRTPFDVLIVNATGRDHPRRAGLALHLGALAGVASVGVTHKPLLAQGAGPTAGHRGAWAPLYLDRELVAHWVRTRAGCRPVVVHAAWSTEPAVAVDVVLAAGGSYRTPAPLREARRLARTERDQAHGPSRRSR